MKSQRPPISKFKKMKDHRMSLQEKQASKKTPRPSIPDFSKNDSISSISKLGQKWVKKITKLMTIYLI